ncbi:MAG TPA: transglutaminase-like domain-containing protein [Thermoanaerobaculia bacterium]|nr:transglutaminase-like domain-containing protein [Thermoanaerobaculia bacterium]
MKHLTALLVVVLIAGNLSAQEKNRLSAGDERLYALARTDIKAFAVEVSKGATSDINRVRAIVNWLTQNFDWKYTDYQKRTVQEVIERRGGNCDDLARVALAAMNALNIRLRRVHEVNIQPISDRRAANARALVKEKGNQYSVFGRHHNDHIWLEVYDQQTDEWFPADPWTGLVGLREWETARVGFGKRTGIAPDAAEMIVPIAIFAADADGNFTIDRTRHYLVDEFDRLYDGKLHELPAWKQWVAAIDRVDPEVGGAFAGKVNLHDFEANIDAAAGDYERLRAEYLPINRKKS